jgi:hypothetical protein
MSGGTPYEVVEIVDFSGGLSKSTSRFALEPNQVREAMNVLIEPDKALTKRKGYSKYTTTTGIGNLTRCYHFYATGSVSSTLVASNATTATKIYKQSSTTLSEITGGSTFSPSATVDIYGFRDYALFFDGTSWDYSSSALSTRAACGFKTGGLSALTPDFMVDSDTRLFVRVPSAPNTLYYTDFDGWDAGMSPAEWDFPSTNFVAIPDYAPDRNGITTAVSVGTEDSLLVFRDNDMWILRGVGSDYSFEKVASPTGCVAKHGAVVTAEGNVIFIGSENVYEYDNRRVNIIGRDLSDSISGKNLRNAWMVYDPDKDVVIWGTEDFTYVWHCSTRSWTELSIIAKDACRLSAAQDYNTIRFIRSDKPHVYTMFDGQVDDSNAGTGTLASSGTAVTGVGTLFLSEVVAGQYITANSLSAKVLSITSNTVLTLEAAFSTNITAGTAYTISTPISVNIVTADYIVGGFYDENLFRSAKFLVDSAQTSPFNVRVYADNNAIRDCGTVLEQVGEEWEDYDGTAFWDGATWGSSGYVATLDSNNTITTPYVDTVGSALRLEITSSDIFDMTLYGAGIEYEKTQRRRE